MSDWEIKMMNRMDEVVQPAARGRPSRFRAAAQFSREWSVRDAWAAACAAQRVNGEYIKEARFEFNQALDVMQVVKQRSRDVMMEFLDKPHTIQPQDYDAADQCQNYLRTDLTYRALQGRLTEFDNSVGRCLAVEKVFVETKHRLEMAVLASLPASVARGQARQNSEQRVKFARGGMIGQPGDKITANIEVISCSYSQQYGIFWIRAITDQDQPVLFSSREKWDVGSHLTVQGKVKAHRDSLTQLNYVKVL